MYIKADLISQNINIKTNFISYDKVKESKMDVS